MIIVFVNNERTAAAGCTPPGHISYGIKCQDDFLNYELWICGSKWLRPVLWWYPSSYLDGLMETSLNAVVTGPRYEFGTFQIQRVLILPSTQLLFLFLSLFTRHVSTT
jgi:hypothetical protein